MKCEEACKELIGYLDRRANSAERQEVEDHLLACGACRTRAEEFRKVWNVLEEVPAIEPSLGFDARVRERVAAEPQRGWFSGFVPQPRLAFSVALLLALSVWMAKIPEKPLQAPVASSVTSETEQFQEIKDLSVLENYEVLTKLDALSELSPSEPVDRKQTPETND